MGYRTGENAGATTPHAPIAGDGEENHVSDAIPKDDGEKGPTPNLGLYGSGSFGWGSMLSASKGGPPEVSPSVPVKDSRLSPGIGPGWNGRSSRK